MSESNSMMDMASKITFEDIEKANRKIQKTKIKDKDYAQVNSRIMAFRELFPAGLIKTELVSNEADSKGVHTAIMRAYAYECDGGKLLGTGTAYEKENSTFINKTSYIENVETSAVGRCLGMLGLGVDDAFASAEEVETAQANQNKKPDESKSDPNKISPAQIQVIMNLYTSNEIKSMIHRIGRTNPDVKSIEDISMADGNKMIRARQMKKESERHE